MHVLIKRERERKNDKYVYGKESERKREQS